MKRGVVKLCLNKTTRSIITPVSEPSFSQKTPTSGQRRPCSRLTKGRRGLVLAGLIDEPGTVARQVGGESRSRAASAWEYGVKN
jgi:hypothetical protein